MRSTAFLAIQNKKQATVVENFDDVAISGVIRVRVPQKLDVPRHPDSKTEKPRHRGSKTKKPQHRVSAEF